MKNILWPAKMTLSRQEVVHIRIYNDKDTEVEVEITKLKPFAPLARIPRSRTAEWRRGYDRALSEFRLD